MRVIKRILLGASWMSFYAGLLYLAQDSRSAVVVFVAFSLLDVIGTCQLYEKKKIQTRTGLPAVINFPCDVAMSLTAIYLGGWMAFAGACMFFAAIVQLSIFGDIATEGFTQPAEQTV